MVPQLSIARCLVDLKSVKNFRFLSPPRVIFSVVSHNSTKRFVSTALRHHCCSTALHLPTIPQPQTGFFLLRGLSRRACAPAKGRFAFFPLKWFPVRTGAKGYQKKWQKGRRECVCWRKNADTTDARVDSVDPSRNKVRVAQKWCFIDLRFFYEQLKKIKEDRDSEVDVRWRQVEIRVFYAALRRMCDVCLGVEVRNYSEDELSPILSLILTCMMAITLDLGKGSPVVVHRLDNFQPFMDK